MRDEQNDMHVVPSDQDHDASPQCWCQPVVSYENPINSARSWVHRRAMDLPHYEKPHNLGGDTSRRGSGPPPMRGE